MVPDIAKSGHSFKGAMAYYLHDKRQEGQTAHPMTADRVAWSDVRNLAVTDPTAAMRVMVATAQQADALKAAAGVKATGSKSKKHVYAYSLSWRADELPDRDPAEMMRAVNSSLKVLGAEHLQAIIVCHKDTEHPHVHVIINRVDPHTGKLFVASNDKYKLSDWANEYERERGLIVTPKREEKRQLREAFKEKSERRAYAEEQRRQAANRPKSDKSRAGILKELQDAQKAQHGQQWRDLSEGNKVARNQIYAGFDAKIAEAIARHKTESKPIWAAYFKNARTDATRAKGLVGTLRAAFEAANHQRATGQHGGRGMLSLVFANTVSGHARQQILQQRQELNRQRMAEKLRGVLSGELAGLKEKRGEALAKQRQAFDQARARLIESQDAERGKIREAWKQIYSDRGKDAATRSAPYVARIAAADRWREKRIEVKEQRPAAPAYRRDVTPTREQLLKGQQRKEALRGDTQRPAFLSRPAPAPASSGEAPRPAQKSAQHLPSKELPPVEQRPDPLRAFLDAAGRGVDQPSSFQKPDEISAAYGKATGSRLSEKKARSEGRTRSQGRVRTRRRDGNDFEQ